MILTTVKVNLFESDARHIVIPIDLDGNCYIPDASLAGVMIKTFWPELQTDILGHQNLGAVVSKELPTGYYLHAIVCYPATREDEYSNATEIMQQCFNNIPCREEEIISSIMIGHGYLNPDIIEAFRKGIELSNKNVVLYELW